MQTDIADIKDATYPYSYLLVGHIPESGGVAQSHHHPEHKVVECEVVYIFNPGVEPPEGNINSHQLDIDIGRPVYCQIGGPVKDQRIEDDSYNSSPGEDIGQPDLIGQPFTSACQLISPFSKYLGIISPSRCATKQPVIVFIADCNTSV